MCAYTFSVFSFPREQKRARGKGKTEKTETKKERKEQQRSRSPRGFPADDLSLSLARARHSGAARGEVKIENRQTRQQRDTPVKFVDLAAGVKG